MRIPTQFMRLLTLRKSITDIPHMGYKSHTLDGYRHASPVLMTVAYGESIKQAGLDGYVTQPKKLRDIVGKAAAKK